MFVRYKTQGIILKKDDWKDVDSFFSVYTKDFGKIRVLGRGIRKIDAKLRAGMELFYFSNLEFIQGKNYKTLVDAVPIERFDSLRNNLEKTITAYRILSIFDGMIQGQEKDEKVWNLLLESLRELNVRENYKIAYYYFLWNFLSVLGYTPNLYCCSLCQRKLEYKENYLNLKGGGIFCFDCSKKEQANKKINSDLIKILRVLTRDKEKSFNLNISEVHFQELKDLSKNYLSLFLNKNE